MQITFYEADDISVPPLNPVERAWVRQANALFAKMPKRLKLLEAGDAVSVIDADAAQDCDLYDGRAHRNGVVLADLPAALFRITGVSA